MSNTIPSSLRRILLPLHVLYLHLVSTIASATSSTWAALETVWKLLEHITLILQELYWLPIAFTSQFLANEVWLGGTRKRAFSVAAPFLWTSLSKIPV